LTKLLPKFRGLVFLEHGVLMKDALLWLLHRAAFQYGVKMADGRKTRRTGPKDEKKELDREWQKIQNIIAKRKTNDPAVGGASSPKAARY